MATYPSTGLGGGSSPLHCALQTQEESSKQIQVQNHSPKCLPGDPSVSSQKRKKKKKKKKKEKILMAGPSRDQGKVTSPCNRRLRIRYQTRKEHWSRAGTSKPFQNRVHSIVPVQASSFQSVYHGHRRRVSIRKLGGWRHKLAFHPPRAKKDYLLLFFQQTLSRLSGHSVHLQDSVERRDQPGSRQKESKPCIPAKDASPGDTIKAMHPCKGCFSRGHNQSHASLQRVLLQAKGSDRPERALP